MTEISNKFLAFLLVIAIIVTIVGAWYSVGKVNDLARITGYGTEGYVNITINNFTSINVTATDCNFGSGYVNTGNLFAVLNPGDSSGDCSATAYSANWTNQTVYNPQCMDVMNDGNQRIAINVSSTKDADGFLGGTSPEYKVWSYSKESAACYGDGIAYNGIDISTTSKKICDCLFVEDTKDELYVGCYLHVPNDAPTGVKTDTWTFTAAAVAQDQCGL